MFFVNKNSMELRHSELESPDPDPENWFYITIYKTRHNIWFVQSINDDFARGIVDPGGNDAIYYFRIARETPVDTILKITTLNVSSFFHGQINDYSDLEKMMESPDTKDVRLGDLLLADCLKLH